MSTPATTPDVASRPVCSWAPDPDGLHAELRDAGRAWLEHRSQRQEG